MGEHQDELPPPKPSKSADAGAPWSRRKKITVGLLVAAALVGAGFWLRRDLPRWLALRDVKRHGAAFSRCAFGDAPRRNETPSKRLRRIFLTAAGLLGQETLAPHGSGWPGRCVEHAVALSDALSRAGKPELAAPSEIGARMFDIARGEAVVDALPLEMLWGYGDSSGGPEEVPLPPSPASPLDLDAPRVAERIAFTDLATDPVPAEGVRLLFRGDRGGLPLLCTLPKGLSEVRCGALAPKARSSHPRLWPPAADGAPALVMDRSASRSTFFRADTGQSFGEAYEVVGGFSAPPGFVAVVEMELGARGEERGLFLERYEDAQFLDRARIEPRPAVPFARVQVLGEKLVWIEPRSGKPHLFVRELGRKKGAPQPIEDAGLLPYEAMRLSACHTEKGIALWAQSKGKSLVTLRETVGGSPFVSVEEPQRDADTILKAEDFGCEEAASSRTRVFAQKDGYEVERVRAEASGAELSRWTLDKLVERRDPEDKPATAQGDESSVVATSLGRLVLVVWRTARAGIRARLALPEGLANAPDVVVYDEASDDVNGAGRVHAMRLVGRKDAALLVLHAASGIKVIRIDDKGVFSALAASP